MKRGGLKRYLSILVVAVVAATTVLVSPPQTVSAEPTTNQVTEENIYDFTDQSQDKNNSQDSSTDSSTETGDDQSTDDTQCEEMLFGFGWIFCPGQNLITTVLSWAMNMIDDTMNWTMLADNADPLRQVWSDFLNIANIVFAIAFLVMIYSMATSTGLSNYDIKKILPRLIIVAVAVNLSFYLCAALVDLSNIAGKGVYSLITSHMNGAGFASLGPNAVASVVGGVISAVLLVLLGGTALLAIIVVLLALIFRNLALVILVAVSPIALALYTLPNTEQWGKKWFNAFISMLIVYPMFTAFWGASQLVSWITAKVGGGVPFLVDIVCAVAPAVAILPIFKAAGGLMGGVTKGIAGIGALKGMEKSVNKASRSAMGQTKAAMLARRGVGGAALAAQNKFGDVPMVGNILRKPGFNSLVNNAQDFESSIDKDALASGTNWAKALTSDQRQSLLTTGSYTDAKGNSVRVLDTYKLRGAFDVEKDELSAEKWGKAMRTANARAAALRSAGRKGEASDLLNSMMTNAKASKSTVVKGSFIEDVAKGNISTTDFDSKYRRSVLAFAADLSAKKAVDTPPPALGYMQSEMAHELEYAKQRGDETAVKQIEKQIQAWQGTAHDALNDSKLRSNINDKTRKQLNRAQYLGEPRDANQRAWADSLQLNKTYDMYQSGDADKFNTALAQVDKIYNGNFDLSNLHKQDLKALETMRDHRHEAASLPVITWSNNN